MTALSSDIAIVLNGNAKSVTDDVIDTIRRVVPAGDLYVSRHLAEAKTIAQTLVEKGYGTILTGGGDGTFTVMVTEIVALAGELGVETPRFGLLKLGTGNALAWMVGASKVDPLTLPDELARLRENKSFREIRLVDVEGFLTPFAGVGADAEVLADYNRTKKLLSKTPLKPVAAGLFGYAVSAVTRSLPGYLLREMAHIRVINEGSDAIRLGEGGVPLGEPYPKGSILYDGKARLCGLSTIPYYGFGMKMFPFSLERPDRMHLRVSTIGSLGFVTNLRSIWDGTYASQSALTDFLVDEVRIECSPATDFQLGGDPQGRRTEVRAKITPKPVRVIDYSDLDALGLS